jgi:hypothetical protein
LERRAARQGSSPCSGGPSMSSTSSASSSVMMIGPRAGILRSGNTSRSHHKFSTTLGKIYRQRQILSAVGCCVRARVCGMRVSLKCGSRSCNKNNSACPLCHEWSSAGVAETERRSTLPPCTDTLFLLPRTHKPHFVALIHMLQWHVSAALVLAAGDRAPSCRLPDEHGALLCWAHCAAACMSMIPEHHNSHCVSGSSGR